MKKGFILVDIPKNCIQCNLRTKCDTVEQNSRPNSCPIHEMPEQMKPSQFPISPILPWQCTEYEKGWNDCIKQMGGE